MRAHATLFAIFLIFTLLRLNLRGVIVSFASFKVIVLLGSLIGYRGYRIIGTPRLLNVAFAFFGVAATFDVRVFFLDQGALLIALSLHFFLLSRVRRLHLRHSLPGCFQARRTLGRDGQEWVGLRCRQRGRVHHRISIWTPPQVDCGHTGGGSMGSISSSLQSLSRHTIPQRLPSSSQLCPQRQGLGMQRC